MTPKGAWPRSRVLLLKQWEWDRYPRSTERISCYCSFEFLLFYYLPIHVIKLRMSTFNKRSYGDDDDDDVVLTVSRARPATRDTPTQA